MASDDFADELFDLMTSDGGRQRASQALRDDVLRRTTGTIRNRRRMRRAIMTATFVACYLGGVATAWLRPAASAGEQRKSEATARLAQNGKPATGGVVRKVIRPEDDQLVDRIASSAAVRLTSYERLLRNGNQQLEKQDGMIAAIRIYKKALQVASADQRLIDPDRDTWLLMALKQSVN